MEQRNKGDMVLFLKLLTVSWISSDRQDIYVTQESLYEKIAAEPLSPAEVGSANNLSSNNHRKLDQK